MEELQRVKTFLEFDKLQNKYGDPNLNSIYGAGKISSPQIMFLFMNPTGRNIASIKSWKGIRAPWIGTKQVWSLFNQLRLLSNDIYEKIMLLKPLQWDESFAHEVYLDIANHNIFITNFVKCTTKDACSLSDKVYKDYYNLLINEIEEVKPQKIISFGNQVSSNLCCKKIKVSEYTDLQCEIVNDISVYPVFYPVGQGRRNLPCAIERIQHIIAN